MLGPHLPFATVFNRAKSRKGLREKNLYWQQKLICLSHISPVYPKIFFFYKKKGLKISEISWKLKAHVTQAHEWGKTIKMLD